MINKSKVLALKYRPQTFSDLIGQNIMAETIINSIKLNKIPNAYLFTGIRGVGKTTAARIVAKSLNCINGCEKLCSDKMCQHCEAIINTNHIDVLEMDAASKTGVDDVRELIEFSKYGPSIAKYKIFIIDEVHMLSKQAFNALLKTLEEPPFYLKFIFATTEVRKIPVTVLSRCQRFDLMRIKSQMLFDYLRKITVLENGEIEDAALKLIVKISEGSVRDSLSLLDRALITQNLEQKELDLYTAQKIFGYFDKSHLIEIFHLILKGKEKEVIEKYRKISDQGVDPKVFLNDFLEILYYIKNSKIFGQNKIIFSLNDDQSKEIEKIAKQIENDTLIMFWQFLIKSMDELNIVSNQNLCIEMLLIRLIHLKEIPKLDEILSDTNFENTNQPLKFNETNIDEVTDINKEPNNNTKSLEQIKNIVQEKKEESSNFKQTKQNYYESIINFKELIDICSKYKEVHLKYDLENNVNLVNFNKGHIEIAFNDKLDKNFIKNLSSKLLNWTGKRWIISLSKKMGTQTTKKIKLESEKNKIKSAKITKSYKKMLEVFPDANLLYVEDNGEKND